MSRWEIHYMTGLQQLYLLDPTPADDLPLGAPVNNPIFTALMGLVALGNALRTPDVPTSDIARATATVNTAVALALFTESGVSPEDAIDLLGELQRHHVGTWSGRATLAGNSNAAPQHLLSAFRSLAALDSALANNEPEPGEAELHAAALANSVMFIAFEAGVFARTAPEAVEAEAAATVG